MQLEDGGAFSTSLRSFCVEARKFSRIVQEAGSEHSSNGVDRHQKGFQESGKKRRVGGEEQPPSYDDKEDFSNCLDVPESFGPSYPCSA